MTGRQMLKLFIENGWKIDRINGSHYIVEKGDKTESIPVHTNKELGKGIQHKLLKRLEEGK